MGERTNPHATARAVFGDEAALIANLECPFTEATRGRPYKWANLKAAPALDWTLDGLAIAILGNNHIADFGTRGVRDTKSLLSGRGIGAPGYGQTIEQALQPAHLAIGNHTLGVVSLCCPTTNSESQATHLSAGVAPLGMGTLSQAIEMAKPTCDALLVYLHWGREHVHDPAPDQLRLARHAIDCGADAVVGCHSHTIQSYENYRGRWIFYGLGNYLFGISSRQNVQADGSISVVPSTLSPSNRESLIVQFSVEPDRENGRLALRRIQPVRFDDDHGPHPISFDELTFNLDACNRDLARYTAKRALQLQDRAEPEFRARVRNGILAYWYKVDSIKRSPDTYLLRPARQSIQENVRRVKTGCRAIARRTLQASAHGLNRLANALKLARWGRYRLGRRLIDALLLPSDLLRVRKSYSAVFGVPPNLLRPRTFNEKVQHRKIFGRKPHEPDLLDKIAVRDRVRSRVGEGVLPRLYWTGDDPREARKQNLPKRFVIKANNSSGANLLVKDSALLDWEAAEELCRRWLEDDYSAHYAEWGYRWIRPRLLIEEYLSEPDGPEPPDYKFLCFDGRVEMIQVDIDRYSNHRRAFFDRDFNRLQGTFRVPQFNGKVPRPTCFQSMREIAERIAQGESFLRVDLYDLGRPVFGELTLYPRAGHAKYEPPEWDERLGALWK